MTDWIWNTGLTNLLVRGNLLLLVTLVVAVASRNCSAAIIYRIWFLGFCSCLFAPVVPYFLPAWSLDVLPSVSSRFESGTEIAPGSARTEFDVTSHVIPTRLSMPEQGASLAANDSSETSASTARPTSQLMTLATTEPPADHPTQVMARSLPAVPLIGARALSIFDLWFAIWLFGIVIIILRTISQYLAIRRFMRQCERIEDSTALRVLSEAAEQIQITTSELMSHATPLAQSSQACGSQRSFCLGWLAGGRKPGSNWCCCTSLRMRSAAIY